MVEDTRHRLRSVAEDLEHLRTDWLQNPTDAAVRRGSVILRQLLAEGVLQRAWKEFGFERQPKIVAPDLTTILGPDFSDVLLATAGGAQEPRGWLAGLLLRRSSTPRGTRVPEDALHHEFQLGEFVESPCVCVGGSFVKRREVVKYFAHVRGGAHLQLSSRMHEEEEELVRRIERWKPRLQVLDRDWLYFELLAIGQCVGKAADSIKLSETIRAWLTAHPDA